jgi:DNA helicase II / ATP-dependent DNA helicase PcrA
VIKYNAKQLEAIQHPQKPLLIIAGAGTGKTSTIVGRMAYLIKDVGASPSNILALTFTVKAAEHLKKSLQDIISDDAKKIHASNFHSFSQGINEEYSKELGYSYPPSILTDSDIYFLLREKFDELQQLDSKIYRRNPIQAIISFKQLFDRFRDDLLSIDELNALREKELSRLPEIENEREKEIIYQLSDAVRVFPKYQEWKKISNKIDFGDMISNVWHLINTAPTIFHKLQAKYKHIIVDEFQDNNYALSQIVRKIAEPENSITVVGDDDQCIYSFRGANIENIHSFENYYKHIDGYSKISLMLNYRSTQEILNIANVTIRPNTNRMPKGILKSNQNHGKIPNLIIGTNNSQTFYISKKINALLSNGVKSNRIAILTRTHNQAKKINDQLRKLRIRTSYTSGKLFNQDIIKDMVSYFQLVGETDLQNLALTRILKSKIGETKTISIVNQLPNNSSLLNYCLDNTKDVLSHNICKEIVKLKQLVKSNYVYDIFWKILVESKLCPNTADKVTVLDKLNILLITQFNDIVTEYAKKYDAKDLSQFIRYLNVRWEVNADFIKTLDSSEMNEAIQLMTVHQAKGKEFEYVFVPFLSSAGFPLNYRSETVLSTLPNSWRRWRSQTIDEKLVHNEEERRIFYVAVTRAEKQLVLTAPKMRQSKFINKLPEKYIQKEMVMNQNNKDSIYQNIIIDIQNNLDDELNANHYDSARDVIEAIEIIRKLENGLTPDWNNNPFESKVMKQLIGVSEDMKPIQELRLSATKISKFENCPLQYKYSEIDRIPGKPSKPYFSLGNVVHKVLEVFHDEGYSSFIEMERLLEKHWTSDGFLFEQEEDQSKSDAKEMLKNYFEFIQKNPVHLYSTERIFKFSLNKCEVSGKCDRIDRTPNGEIKIYDYKTSKYQKSEKELKKDIQLAIYAMYSNQPKTDDKNSGLGRIPKELSLLSLRHENPKVSVTFTEEKLEEFKTYIDNIALKIREGDFPSKPSYNCQYCDYRDLICPDGR